LKVKFTASAKEHFLEGLTYIYKENPTAAKTLLHKVEKSLKRLELYPKSGRQIPEFPDLPHRELIVNPYRFSYRVVGKTVWIVAVWHGARIPRRPEQ
jgi:toxin ParE1/3/4